MEAYTPAEQKLLSILQKHGRLDTGALLELRYKGDKNRPTFAREALSGTLSKLIRKVKANKEPFRLQRTDRRGPHAVEYWVEER